MVKKKKKSLVLNQPQNFGYYVKHGVQGIINKCGMGGGGVLPYDMHIGYVPRETPIFSPKFP